MTATTIIKEIKGRGIMDVREQREIGERLIELDGTPNMKKWLINEKTRMRMMRYKVKTKIVSDPNICGGEPCIRDTRIPVYVILSHLAAGEDYDAILKNFPRLKYDDVVSCLEYAAYLSTEKAVYDENRLP